MERACSYNRAICSICLIDSDRARLVEAFLRLKFGALDSLSRLEILDEYKHEISQTIDEDPHLAEALADSYGL